MGYLKGKSLKNKMADLAIAALSEQRELGYRPTDSKACQALYNFSRRSDIDPIDASELMRSLGYEPYQGFPLRFVR